MQECPHLLHQAALKLQGLSKHQRAALAAQQASVWGAADKPARSVAAVEAASAAAERVAAELLAEEGRAQQACSKASAKKARQKERKQVGAMCCLHLIGG